jgi:Tol biopolymer transport system component
VVAGSGLEIAFHSERAGGAGKRDLYRATRPDLGSPWGTPVAIAELNTAGNDESAFFLPGDLVFLFGSERAGQRDIYQATRTTVGAPFGTPVPFENIDTTQYEESDPWLSDDGHTLIFATNRTGDSEIFEATR